LTVTACPFRFSVITVNLPFTGLDSVIVVGTYRTEPSAQFGTQLSMPDVPWPTAPDTVQDCHRRPVATLPPSALKSISAGARPANWPIATTGVAAPEVRDVPAAGGDDCPEGTSEGTDPAAADPDPAATGRDAPVTWDVGRPPAAWPAAACCPLAPAQLVSAAVPPTATATSTTVGIPIRDHRRVLNRAIFIGHLRAPNYPSPYYG
jgi:hypothetical protein